MRLMVIPVLVLTVACQCGAQSATRPSAGDLRPLADRLLKEAVRRPYGCGWVGGNPTDDKLGAAPMVSFAPSDTPAAALVLWFCGRELGEERYLAAAREAARAMTLSQEPSGKIPGTAPFGFAGDRSAEVRAAIPDRASTRAAIALWTIILGESGAPNDPLRSATLRAAAWMERQQAGGGWPQAYPLGAPQEEARTLYLLTNSDWRDSSLAMMLVASVLHDRPAARSVERERSALLDMRISQDESIGVDDWCSANEVLRQPVKDIPEQPYMIDTAATRWAMQTLLCDAVIGNHPEILPSLDAANLSLKALRRPDGKWERRYYFWQESATRPAAGDRSPGKFHDIPSMDTTPHADALVSAVDLLHEQGLAMYRTTCASDEVMRRQLALTIVGLIDDPLEPGALVEYPPAADRGEDVMQQARAVFAALVEADPAGFR